MCPQIGSFSHSSKVARGARRGTRSRLQASRKLLPGVRDSDLPTTAVGGTMYIYSTTVLLLLLSYSGVMDPKATCWGRHSNCCHVTVSTCHPITSGRRQEPDIDAPINSAHKCSLLLTFFPHSLTQTPPLQTYLPICKNTYVQTCTSARSLGRSSSDCEAAGSSGGSTPLTLGKVAVPAPAEQQEAGMPFIRSSKSPRLESCRGSKSRYVRNSP